jgi:hypothetical protein
VLALIFSAGCILKASLNQFVHHFIILSPFIRAINPAVHHAVFFRLSGFVSFLENRFCNALNHINMDQPSAAMAPNCSQAFFCLGLFSMLGKRFQSTSQNHFHNFDEKDSG